MFTKILLFVGLATPALSQATPVYSVARNTCAALNYVLNTSPTGTAVFKYRFLGVLKTHHRTPNCGYYQRVKLPQVNAADGWCFAGYTCQTISRDSGHSHHRYDDDDDRRGSRSTRGPRNGRSQNRDRQRDNGGGRLP